MDLKKVGRVSISRPIEALAESTKRFTGRSELIFREFRGSGFSFLECAHFPFSWNPRDLYFLESRARAERESTSPEIA